jgi:hypothetical protein
MPLALLAALALAQTPAPVAYTGKLGTPYLLGPVATVIGSKERIEIGVQRLVTLRSVETAIAFGGKRQTFVAAKGQKLVVFRATIKNPEKNPIRVSPSDTFGLRIFDTKFVAGDVSFLGAFTDSLDPLSMQLKSKQSVDVVTVYQFPETTPHLRIAIYFDRFQAKKDPRFDLTKQIRPARSVFAADAMNYRPTASAQVGKWFDLDDLEFNVASCEKASGGYKVRVQVRNPMSVAGRWGWQYAKATLVDAAGERVDYYPDFVATPEHADWRNEIPGGKSVAGDYTFNTGGSFVPVKLVLRMVATERQVEVKL